MRGVSRPARDLTEDLQVTGVVERALVQAGKGVEAGGLRSAQIARTECQLRETQLGPRATPRRGTLLRVRTRPRIVALVERDLAEICEHRRFPVGTLEVALRRCQLLLELDRASEVPGEARDLAAPDEQLRKPAAREATTRPTSSGSPLASACVTASRTFA